MTRKSKAQYQTDLDATIGANGSGGITGTIANDRYEDLKDSAMWWDEGPVPAWFVGLPTFTPILTDIVPAVDSPDASPIVGKLTWQSVFDLFRATGGADAAFIGTGTFANARISQASVKQHEAALSILSSQIVGLPPGLVETDPIVGAINGIVRADGAGNISTAIPGTHFAAVSHTHVAANITDFNTAADARIASAVGVTVQQFDADILFSDVTRALTAGYTTAALDLGTRTTGTLTLNMATRNNQRIINGGAFTLAPPTGEGSMLLKITNGSGAGAITLSGFSSPRLGDPFTTTVGHIFWCMIAVNGGESIITVTADGRNT